MKNVLLLLALCLSLNLYSQEKIPGIFTLNDTVFEVEDKMFTDVVWAFSGPCWPMENKNLDSLAVFLQENPQIKKILIECHSDSRPIPMTNDTLSQRRAEGIRDYLVEQGVEPDRVIPVGYGEREPRLLMKDRVVKFRGIEYQFPKGTVLNDEYINAIEETGRREAAHSLNRRVVIRIKELEE